jgi:glycyl-tRNA synthetase
MSQDVYDKIMMLAKRKGFIFPSFEIYGGIAGFYDYGPLGSRLKKNVEDLWRSFFLLKDNCIEINTPTITLHEVLKASGHVEEFTDLTVDCLKCKQSFKIEEIVQDQNNIEKAIQNDELKCPNCSTILKNPYHVNLMFSTKIGIGSTRDAFLRPETAQGIFTNFHLLYRHMREKLPFGVIQIGRGYRNEISPRQGPIRQREFNMAEAEIFFDPENKNHKNFDIFKEKIIYLYDNKNLMKLSLDEAVNKCVINNQALAYYMYITQDFLIKAGIDPKKFRFRKHADNELAHYAKECWDAELFSDRFGWVECVGIADRSAYDLNAHIESSKIDMFALRKFDEPKTEKIHKIFPKMEKIGPKFKDKAGLVKTFLENTKPVEDNNLTIEINGESIVIPNDCYEIKEEIIRISGEKFVPHVIEPSYGIDRILYFILEHNYNETEKKGEEYRILKINPIVAPIKVGVLPLINNKKLINISKDIDSKLRNQGILTYYDEGGTIGRRYARMDEIGTPFCVTVDHQTLKDNTVTIRYRDTTKQDRKKIEEIIKYIKKQIEY